MNGKSIVIGASALLFVLLLTVGSVTLAVERQTPSRIIEHSTFQTPSRHFDHALAPCTIVNDVDNPGFFFADFDSGMGFAVYMDPEKCGASPYPFKITEAHLYLYEHTEDYKWPVNIRVSIRQVLGGDKCLGPSTVGVLCYEDFSIPIDSSWDSLGRPMNLSLSSYCCVDRPFFLQVSYLDHSTPTAPLPSPLMDDVSPPADTCDNWFLQTYGYVEWSDIWQEIPGDAIIRAAGYTQDEECEDLWYWKPDTIDAPSGMPDFDQNQDQWDGYCGPAAAANCLWWFGAVPPTWSQPQLIDTLAKYFHTEPPYYTFVDNMQIGLEEYFANYGFAYQESTFEMPDFYEMEDSLKRCQDIILLLGFWWYNEQAGEWNREGGHFVTMAGVCSESLKIAISDPDRDAAEGGWPGRVRPAEHNPHPGDPILHNDPTFVSHDMYQSTLEIPSPSPGNPFWEINYTWARGKFSGMNVPKKFLDVTRPAPEGAKDLWVTEVEYAVMICPKPTAVEGEEEEQAAPRGFELYQNYPNPFNAETIIRFYLRRPAEVSLTIYNILGQKVRTLVQERLPAGPQTINWDGFDEKGKELSSGVYFYRLRAGDLTETKRLVLLK